jgi:hypothetical protein
MTAVPQLDLFAPPRPVVAAPRRAEPQIFHPVLDVSEDEQYWLTEAREGVDTEREDGGAFKLLYIVRYVDRISEPDRDVWKITRLGETALRIGP